jgi:hypothetical protein
VAVIDIDNLTLKLNGISEHEGAVLAWKIREALAQATVGKGQNARFDSLKIGVERREGEGMDILGKRIVANLLSQIEKTG